MSQLNASIEKNQPARLQLALDPWVAFAFLYPFGRLLVVDIGGKVFLQDFLAMFLLLVMARQHDTPQRLRMLWTFFVLLAFWLANLIVTDLYRGTAVDDIRRGWFKIILFGTQVAALWIFLPRRRAYMAAFGVGLGIASYLASYQLEPPLSDAPWKFGLGEGVAVFAATLACGVIPGTLKLRRYSWAILWAAAVIMLLKEFRAMFGVLLMAGGYCLVALTIERSPWLRARMSKTMFAGMVVVGLVASQGTTAVYGNLAESGSLGTAAQFKYRAQTEGDVSLLRGGRVESLVSTIAIADSPIIGHGSWARDIYYVRLLRERMKELGLRLQGDIRTSNDLIPTHSYLFGAWVEAGIMGAVFWFYIATMCAMMTYQLLKRAEPFMPLAIYAAINLIWSIAFSPFGAEARFTVAFELSIVMWILRTSSPALRAPFASIEQRTA